MLEYEKSSFLIDLIKHKSGTKFVKITQSIDEGRIRNELKINPTILKDLISILQQFDSEIEDSSVQNSSLYFSDERQNAMISRYFKGVTIKDLTLQFDCTVETIKQILFNKGIPIVDNTMPKSTGRKRYFKRKR